MLELQPAEFQVSIWSQNWRDLITTLGLIQEYSVPQLCYGLSNFGLTCYENPANVVVKSHINVGIVSWSQNHTISFDNKKPSWFSACAAGSNWKICITNWLVSIKTSGSMKYVNVSNKNINKLDWKNWDPSVSGLLLWDQSGARKICDDIEKNYSGSYNQS